MILLKEYPVMDNTQSVADYAETVAKAQLKKMVEWGDGDCEHLESRMEYTRPRRACKKCWQALLRECE